MRPTVSVVVPFAGTSAEARALVEGLGALALGPADEVLIVDNTADGVLQGDAGSGLRVLHRKHQASSYYARNAGAEAAKGEWLLFIDADCRPPATLLDDYFSAPLPDRCGLVAGGVAGEPTQTTLVTRWARDRGHVGERYHAESGERPAGITANLLVRRDAWKEAGGFQEGIRSAGDIELCWRVQELGWGFEHRPSASVDHVHVETLAPLLRKGARYGAGRTWLNRRYPGAAPPPRVARELARAVAVAGYWLLRLTPSRAAFKLIDGAWYVGVWWGHVFGDNRASTRASARVPDSTLVAYEFPRLEEAGPTPVAAVEAARRPQRPDRQVGRASRVFYLEDDRPVDRARESLTLALEHPLRMLRLRRDPRRPCRIPALAPSVRRVAERNPQAVASVGGQEADALRAAIAQLTGAV